jgi:hypothetical protein
MPCGRDRQPLAQESNVAAIGAPSYSLLLDQQMLGVAVEVWNRVLISPREKRSTHTPHGQAPRRAREIWDPSRNISDQKPNDVGQTVFLPALLKFLKQKAPSASARVLPIPLDNPGAALSAGAVDFAAGFFDNLTTGFFQTLVFHERSVCIVRARAIPNSALE